MQQVYIYIYQMYTQTNYIECTESVIMHLPNYMNYMNYVTSDMK